MRPLDKECSCPLVPICLYWEGQRCPNCPWVMLYNSLARFVIRQQVECKVRCDPAGDGHYHAPRTKRNSDGTEHHYEHCGIDYLCTPGAFVYSPVHGHISKLGYAYNDDLSWTYVQITSRGGLHHRLFYVKAMVTLHSQVSPDTRIGLAQDISIRYPGQQMQPHIHYEVMDGSGKYYDPEG